MVLYYVLYYGEEDIVVAENVDVEERESWPVLVKCSNEENLFSVGGLEEGEREGGREGGREGEGGRGR